MQIRFIPKIGSAIWKMDAYAKE